MENPMVELLLYQMDQAYADDEEHALLLNLRSVAPTEWRWKPEGSKRSIQQIVAHVAACKYMYENATFGDGSMSWNRPPVNTFPQEADPEVSADDVMAWLDEAQQRLRASVSALRDDQLSEQRPLNWGGSGAIRWIVNAMIQHDLYHAGEINHLRGLREGNDGWEWDQKGD
ncbi:MAG: DinB family protein [Dehalococcoidia bacterium]